MTVVKSHRDKWQYKTKYDLEQIAYIVLKANDLLIVNREEETG